MDDYLKHYIQDKKNLTFEDFLDKIKIPQNAMIPPNMNQTNLNKLGNPGNLPKIATPSQDVQSMNNPQNAKFMPANVNIRPSIPANFPGNNMFPRFGPQAMNAMMLQQQQMMKNPMFMQWMRPQMMQNMIRMNMMAGNFNIGNVPNVLPMNQQKMEMKINPNINVDSSQIQTQGKFICLCKLLGKETTGKDINVNISEFIRNINPFDKSQIKDSKETIRVETTEIVEKKNNSSGDEDEEEGNFFLKSVEANSSVKNCEAERENDQFDQSPNKNHAKTLDISNILQFVNILKKKKDSENDVDEAPRDPRMKQKKK